MQKVLFFAVCCWLGALNARELYVSVSGDNKNQGTEKAPFATIAHAVKKAAPGDTVKIGPGIYREQILVSRSGKKGSPITIAGSRGRNGEFLTIIEAPGTVIKKWEKAPEIGPDIWKTKMGTRPDLVMMDGKMIAFINRLTMALPRWKQLPAEINAEMLWNQFGPACKRLPGLDLLSLPKEIWVSHPYFRKRKEQFFPVLNYVLSGWRDGFLYVRFANGDTPEKHLFTASRGEGFILRNASFLHFRDLHLRGSRRQFFLQDKSSWNRIENCLLMHGGNRILIGNKASYNEVRNCIMTAGFVRNDLFQLRSSEDMRGGLVYLIFKYIIGVASSDDIGVYDRGMHSKIIGNVIVQGLIGLDAYGVKCEVRDNVVREMSSVGICTGGPTYGHFTGNLVQNCGIPLRIHDLRSVRTERLEYHYKNLYVQAPNGGSQTYVHCESHRWGPDQVNFEKDAKGQAVYKKNPPAPVDAGKIYIYHNTFWGGDNFTPGFSVDYISRRFRMVMPFYFVNNVVKSSHRWNTSHQELLNNNLLYTFDKIVLRIKPQDPKVAEKNRIIDEKVTETLWNKKDLPGLPDMTLGAASPALNCGIDVSRPFTANGKKFEALPGFKPGYFKGKAPAAGAFQAGEDQKKFIEMHQKTERIIKMLGQLRERR